MWVIDSNDGNDPNKGKPGNNIIYSALNFTPNTSLIYSDFTNKNINMLYRYIEEISNNRWLKLLRVQ